MAKKKAKRKQQKNRPAKPARANGKVKTKAGGRRKSSRQARAERRRREARMKQIRIVGIVVLLAAVFAGLIVWRNAGVVPVEELSDIPPLLDGPADAPVKVVEYGDLACSACRQWHNLGIKEQLKADFGDQVSFEFRHFPVITATSPAGAQAAQCAAEQDAFWPFHDYIYENLEVYPAFSHSRLKEIAATVGLEAEPFATCLDSGKYQDFVNEAIRIAQAAGARGTPTFFVNGQQVSPSYQSMAAAIQTQLGG